MIAGGLSRQSIKLQQGGLAELEGLDQGGLVAELRMERLTPCRAWVSIPPILKVRVTFEPL